MYNSHLTRCALKVFISSLNRTYTMDERGSYKSKSALREFRAQPAVIAAADVVRDRMTGRAKRP